MRHGILGPGGVGGLVSAVLADAGENVTLLVRPGTESLYPREISLESPFRNLRAPVSISSRPEGQLDVIWITVKATQLHSALQSLPADFEANIIVPLLNGVDHIDVLRNRFGRRRVLPATIAVETDRIAPGTIVQRSPFIRFCISDAARGPLDGVLQLLQQFGFECLFYDDETTLMWSKLVFLAPIALSTAAARSPIGGVLGDPPKAALLEGSTREACAVATKAGAKVDADAILARIKSLPPHMRSSMEKDIANGCAPELDAIAGPILRGAAKYDIALHATLELVRKLSDKQQI